MEADLPDDSSSSQYDLTIIATKLINFFLFIPTLHLVLLQSSSLKDRHLQLRFLLLWNRNMPTDRLTTLHNQRFTKKPMPLFQRTFFKKEKPHKVRLLAFKRTTRRECRERSEGQRREKLTLSQTLMKCGPESQNPSSFNYPLGVQETLRPISFLAVFSRNHLSDAPGRIEIASNRFVPNCLRGRG